MTDRFQLVVIDPQNDFCDPAGSLFVPGADEDCVRLAEFIRRATPVLDDIHVTLDSHQFNHIAHPHMTVDGSGSHPDPFTNISHEQVMAGEFRTTNPGLNAMFKDYLRQLKENGRYDYTVWPVHCLISSWGGITVPEVFEALNAWARAKTSIIGFVPKGSSWKTEHYSAVQADVPDPDDLPNTGLNMRFVEALEKATRLYWTGQASSHCVANTCRDVADNFSDEAAIARMVLLEDCMSPVPGCEAMADEAIAAMVARGMKVTTSVEAMKELGV